MKRVLESPRIADPEPYEEPTWEVREPGRNRTDRRTKTILAAAALIAIVVNLGAGWAYWKVTHSQPEAAQPGSAVELTLHAHSDLNLPLAPGSIGDLTVTLTNDNPVTVRITSVNLGGGPVVADQAHRTAGCVTSPLQITHDTFTVNWEIAPNTIAAFTLSDSLRMAVTSNSACAGATFTVPVRASGFSVRAPIP